MDTEKLRALILAAEEGSLSGAARRLGLTISTISRKIMDLEHEVGATLLLRTGRDVRLTPQGQGLVEHARELLRGLDQALAMARTTERAALTHLRLSAPVELALTLLPQVIASLHHAHPELIIEVISEARRAALFEDGFDTKRNPKAKARVVFWASEGARCARLDEVLPAHRSPPAAPKDFRDLSSL